jgi:starvation-inducible DNA-binding protein
VEDLKQSLKESLATVFALYVKAQNFHWNVEGPNFFEYHKLFGEIYEDVYGSVDPLAEHVRALDSYTPGSFKRFTELSQIEDEVNIPSAKKMITKLLVDNEKTIEVLNKTMKLAEKHNKQGLMNYLGERIELHNKWSWFLRASSKE